MYSLTISRITTDSFLFDKNDFFYYDSLPLQKLLVASLEMVSTKITKACKNKT
jgi:hypothetical protein